MKSKKSNDDAFAILEIRESLGKKIDRLELEVKFLEHKISLLECFIDTLQKASLVDVEKAKCVGLKELADFVLDKKPISRPQNADVYKSE